MGELRIPAPDRTEIQLETGIFQVTPDVLRLNDGFVNFYIASGTIKSVVIDSGFGDSHLSSQAERMVENLGLPVEAIIVTHHHPDHAGGVKRLTFTLGVPVIDDKSETDAIDLGGKKIRILPGKGHTADSQYVLEETEGVLFTGDNILGDSTADVEYMKEYMDGLEHLMKLEPKIICPGHGDPSYNAMKDIQELMNHRLMREEQILDAIRRGAQTPTELYWTVYGIDYKEKKTMATDQIKAHLAKLHQEQKVGRKNGKWIITG